MISKIKHKLFLYFLLFSSISLLAVITSVWFYKKKENVSKITENLDDIYILNLKSFKLQQDFLNYEVINPDFFKDNHSLILDKQKAVSAEISNKFKQLLQRKESELMNANGNLDKIQAELKKNKLTFEKVVEQIKNRGFQDFGIEGKMRKHAHALMALGSDIEQVKILMLRRHEKDFIIRKESQYVNKFNALIIDVENEIDQNAAISPLRKKDILATVDNYYLSFKKLILLERKLGLKGKSGLLLDLSENSNRIQNYFELEKKMTHTMELSIHNKLNTIALITSFIIIAITVLFSYIAATAFRKPLISLTDSIKKYVSNDFLQFPLEDTKAGNYEIEILQSNFIIMSQEIRNHINYFKEKVDERTQEILIQKDEILHQQDKIIVQRDQLKIQKEILEIQKKDVTEKNKNILDSIHYAKRIQKAILPQQSTIQTILPNSFVYYEPKDIVSGDFYWIDKINFLVEQNREEENFNNYNNSIASANSSTRNVTNFNFDTEIKCLDSSEKIIFAAVDCTGHGVPGALMSVIGYNSLNKIIYEYNISEPAAILNQLNIEVRQTLRQDNDHAEVKDGMDIALCSLDLERNILQFAGANNPLYIVRNNELKIIKGDRFPIGVYNTDTINLFNNHIIQLREGDAIYIFSDGKGINLEEKKERNLKINNSKKFCFLYKITIWMSKKKYLKGH